ncbi:MAG: carbon-nitrogen hydrolase family protein [Acidobacteria bacterium]|nr:MAG: carbon-nitrogen hydrolase family protein [Acidobacteriota bacterium]
MKTFKVAAVQTAPVFLNLKATVEKTCSLIGEAARNGAALVAFPEAFIPAYPYWAWLETPLESRRYYTMLYENAMTIPGPWIDALCKAAKENHIIVVVGVNEIDPVRTGTIYNTNVIINNDGHLLGRHRKLVPTYAEKLVWGNGDGSGLRVYETECGRIGTLLCGENTNTLARFALLAQGEQVHVANFPAFPFTEWYEEAEAIRIRCQAHAFEGKIFVIVSTSLIDEGSIDLLCRTPEQRRLFEGERYALTAVFGPDGRYVAGPLIDEEGIVYADIDLNALIAPKLMHDITGHYNQFSVLSLRLNRAPHRPLIESAEDGEANADRKDIELPLDMESERR